MIHKRNVFFTTVTKYQSIFNRFPAYVLSDRGPAGYFIHASNGLFLLVTEAPRRFTAAEI